MTPDYVRCVPCGKASQIAEASAFTKQHEDSCSGRFVAFDSADMSLKPIPYPEGPTPAVNTPTRLDHVNETEEVTGSFGQEEDD